MSTAGYGGYGLQSAVKAVGVGTAVDVGNFRIVAADINPCTAINGNTSRGIGVCNIAAGKSAAHQSVGTDISSGNIDGHAVIDNDRPAVHSLSGGIYYVAQIAGEINRYRLMNCG